MTLNSMATEVAGIFGGVNDATIVTQARSAIKASIEDWNSAKYWNFLLKDTGNGFTVSPVTWTGAVTTLTPTTSGDFDGVNVGQGVIGTGIQANTTISSITRNVDGTVASIVLSLATTGSQTAVTLTFSADIPLIANTSEYNLPVDFLSPHGARLLTTKRQLVYIKYREWNRKVTDQTSQGAVEAYTVYNPSSPLTQNFGTYRLRVFRPPSAADTLHLQYFRFMEPDATNVDIPDRFLRKLIDYAQWRLQRMKNADDSRLSVLEEAAKSALASAMVLDEEIGEDEDVHMISQMEGWNGDRPLWGNGAFYPLASDY